MLVSVIQGGIRLGQGPPPSSFETLDAGLVAVIERLMQESSGAIWSLAALTAAWCREGLRRP